MTSVAVIIEQRMLSELLLVQSVLLFLAQSEGRARFHLSSLSSLEPLPQSSGISSQPPPRDRRGLITQRALCALRAMLSVVHGADRARIHVEGPTQRDRCRLLASAAPAASIGAGACGWRIIHQILFAVPNSTSNCVRSASML